MKLKCSVCGETKFESIYHCGQPMEEVFPLANMMPMTRALDMIYSRVPEAKEVQDDTD